MRYFKIIIFSLGLVFTTSYAVAQQHQFKILTMEDNGKEISLAPGETIELQLQENGSTGFIWYTDEVDESRLKLVGKKRLNPYMPKKFDEKGPPAGVPYERFWTFKAIAPGDTVLRLLLYPNWEGKGYAAKKFELKVHITSASKKDK